MLQDPSLINIKWGLFFMPVFPNIYPGNKIFIPFARQLKQPDPSPSCCSPGKLLHLARLFFNINIGKEKKKWGSENETKF
jgi:hypothetical protein